MIVDFIFVAIVSGGAGVAIGAFSATPLVRALRRQIDNVVQENHLLTTQRKAALTALDNTHASYGMAVDLAQERREILQQIAACETPASNGTVRKMAKLARQGVGK
jgi:hypothetical protein